jgi:hypothetical protein
LTEKLRIERHFSILVSLVEMLVHTGQAARTID